MKRNEGKREGVGVLTPGRRQPSPSAARDERRKQTDAIGTFSSSLLSFLLLYPSPHTPRSTKAWPTKP